MQSHMISLVPHLTTNCRIRHVRVSVPLIAALLDNQRYYLPDELAPPVGEELRPMFRPRITTPHDGVSRTPRAPSLRSLVKLALECDSAEEMGKKLKQRFERQQQRKGAGPAPDRAAEAELDRLLGPP